MKLQGWKKKLIIGLGAFFSVILVAIVVIPFLIDVDHYRPQIVDAANQHLNGKLELGKLKLSLWGQIKIEVEGFSIRDANGRSVVQAKDVFFHVPFAPIFTGSPVITFKLQAPELNVIKDKAGKLNVLTLVKMPATGSGTSESTPAPSAPGAKSEPVKLPGIVSAARLGFEMRGARLLYKDATTDLTSEIKDLNLVVKDISLSKPLSAEMWANLDTKLGKLLTVKGPIRLSVHATSHFQGTDFQSADVRYQLNLNELEILMPGTFEKTKAIVANGEGNIGVTLNSAKIVASVTRFHNAEIKTSGQVTELTSATGPKFDLHIESNEIALQPWTALIVAMRGYEIQGAAKMKAALAGTATAPQYEANLNAKGVSAKAPHLKSQPKIDAEMHVITDLVDKMNVTVSAPGNDLRVSGKIANFAAPKMDFTVMSSGMDLDALIDFPKPAPKGSATTASAPNKDGKSEKSAVTAKPEPADFDEMLDPVRENKMLKESVADLKWNLKFVKAYQTKIENISGRLLFKNLVASLESAKLSAFSGTVTTNAQVNVAPKTPTYRFSQDVSGLNIQSAVESQFALFKNTLLGIAYFKMEGSGASFNPEPAKKNLNAKGNMKVDNAIFATIDIGRMAAEGVNKAINDISAKVSQLKGKSVTSPKSVESGYESVSSDFTIQNGVFSAPNFFAKAKPNGGIDVKGNTTLNIINLGLNAQWEVVDTYNLTKARDLSVEVNGVAVNNILADGANPVRYPIIVSGTAIAPEFNYGSVPEALGKVALANVSRAVEGKAKEELRKRAEEEAKKLTQKAPPPVQNAIKDIKKKLFGN